MKTNTTPNDPDRLDDLDFHRAARGPYNQRYTAESKVVVLAPDVAECFPDSESVNAALRALIKIAKYSVKGVTY